MNNLKRILSLALASVMVLGMMVVSASAFDDDDVIANEHKTAAEIMNVLGIIKGRENADGSFNFDPKAPVKRSEMAKMITVALTGDPDYNIGLANNGTFSDVPENHWAVEYIEYCASLGIIAGRGNGKFDPDANVTGQEAAKMMLVALGYKADIFGFAPGATQWASVVDSYAENLPLDTKLEDGEAVADHTISLYDDVAGARTQALTREDAAQLIYNGLQARTVTSKVTGVQNGAPTYKFNLFDAPLLTKVFKAKVDEDHTLEGAAFNAETGKFTYTLNQLEDEESAPTHATKIDATTLIGQKIRVVSQGTTVLAISAVGNVAASLDGSAWLADRALDADKQAYELASSPVYYLNGVKQGAAVTPVAGSIVELINNNADKKIEAVRVTNKEVSKLSADPEVTTDGEKVSIAGSNGLNLDKVAVETVKGYEDLKKDDTVLYVTVAGITTFEKAEKVTGKITAANSDKTEYTMNGNKLTYSGLTGAATTKVEDNGKTDFKNDWDFYLDNGGHIVALAPAGEPTPDPVDKYAVTEEFGLISTGNAGAIGAETSTTYQIKMFFAETGKSDVVELVKYTSGSNIYVAGTPNTGETAISTVINEDKNGTLQTSHKGILVKYTENNGKYTVEEVGTTGTNSDINGGKPVFSDDADLVANANTTFIVKSGSGTNVKTEVIVGYANLPTATDKTSATPAGPDNKGQNIQTVKPAGSDFVSLVYFEVPAFDSVTTVKTAYFIKNAGATETAEGYTVKAIVDGELKDMVIKAANYATVASAVNTGLATVTYDADGKITAATAVADEDLATAGWVKATGVTRLGDFVKSGSNVYEVASGAQIFKVKNGTATAIELSKLTAALTSTTETYNALINKDVETAGITVMIIEVVAAGDPSTPPEQGGEEGPGDEDPGEEGITAEDITVTATAGESNTSNWVLTAAIEDDEETTVTVTKVGGTPYTADSEVELNDNDEVEVTVGEETFVFVATVADGSVTFAPKAEEGEGEVD